MSAVNVSYRNNFIKMITKAPKGSTFVGKCDACGITLIQTKIVIPRCPVCKEQLKYRVKPSKKPMQRPLTVEELRQLEDVYIWEERRTVIGSYFTKSPASILAMLLDVNKDDDFYRYGHKVRAWRQMPSDEEMEAAAWQS